MLTAKAARLYRMQNEPHSILIDGYIRNIAATLPQSIPPEISDICFQFYFNPHEMLSSVSKSTAAAMLARLLGTSSITSKGTNPYKQLFKKYEKMLQLGMNVIGATNRMRSDGIEKDAIIAFKKKHKMDSDGEEIFDPIEFGLQPKGNIIIGNGIKMKRLMWKQINIKKIIGSIWKDVDEMKIEFDHKHFEHYFQLKRRNRVHHEMMMENKSELDVGIVNNLNNFRECIKRNIVPNISWITYESILNEYQFDIKEKRQNMELMENNDEFDWLYSAYSVAKVLKLDFMSCCIHDTEAKDDDEFEYYILIHLNSSIKNYHFKRKHLNIVILLDFSGLMRMTFGCDSNKSKMEIANKAVIGLLKHLTDKDRFGIILFDDAIDILQHIQSVGNIDDKILEKRILKIIPRRDAINYEKAYNKAVELFDDIKCDIQYENRIIMITQPNYGSSHPNDLIDLISNNALNESKTIYTTLIGVGLEFDINLIEDIMDTKGCNYFFVESEDVFMRQMNEEFDNMVTPLAFNVCLKLKCKERSCYIDKVYAEKQRQNEIVKNGEIMKINTIFPPKSSILNNESKNGMELIQLKRIPDSDSNDIKTEIILIFEDRNGKKHKKIKNISLNSNSTINDNKYDEKSVDYYDNNRIRKAILLCKYTDIIKYWIRLNSFIKTAPNPLHFISKQRRKEVMIGLRKLCLTIYQLRSALLNMDETIMNTDNLYILLSIIPSMNEQIYSEKQIIEHGTRNPIDYGVVEQFFFAMSDFNELEQRIKLWIFKQNFFEIRHVILKQYKSIGKASDKIRSNRNMKLLLSIILAFGNHMNSETFRGCAHGFDLEILIKLKYIESSFDKQQSLLMYIYQFCDQRYPLVLTLIDALYPFIKRAYTIDLKALYKSFQMVSEYGEQIKNLVISDEIEKYDINDRFIVVMTKFYKKAWNWIRKMNMTIGSVEVGCKRILKKFAFMRKDYIGQCDEYDFMRAYSQFLKILYEFLEDLKYAKEKLIKMENKKYENNSNYKTKLHKSCGVYKCLEKQWQFKKYRNDLYDRFLTKHIENKLLLIYSRNDDNINCASNKSYDKVEDNLSIKSIFDIFTIHFEQEMKVCKDKQLSKELEILNYIKYECC